MRVYGMDAIEAKRNNADVEINKFSDPIEAERFDLSVDEAEDVSSEDPGLIYCDLEG